MLHIRRIHNKKQSMAIDTNVKYMQENYLLITVYYTFILHKCIYEYFQNLSIHSQ